MSGGIVHVRAGHGAHDWERCAPKPDFGPQYLPPVAAAGAHVGPVPPFRRIGLRHRRVEAVA